jgi:WD40 repeat protein/outer membrane protein assembly factor BamD (BamD/ComL family)
MDTFDFQLEISPGSARDYQVTARAPSGGEATASLHLPLTIEELDQQLAVIKDAVLLSSTVVRRLARPEEQPVQRLGQLLFDALLTGDVRGLFGFSYQQARAEGKPLRLVLRVQPPELAQLPWEFLYDPGRQDYLSLSLPLVRYPQVLDPRRPLPVAPPLRILAMAARPGDRDALQVEDEQRRLAKALAGLERDGQVQLNWVPGQTWSDLEDAMDQGPWHIFHFIGHGGFDRNTDEGTIALATEDGRTDPVGADDFSRLLGDHHSLRLVMLNACDTGQASSLDTFSSTAGALVRRGLPAVVAMQFEITDLAAIEFARTFYEATAKRLPVDVSVMRARRRMKHSKKDTLEWGTPVLYLRSLESDIFQVAAASSPGDPVHLTLAQREDHAVGPDSLESLYDEGLAAFWTEQWEQAVDLFGQIVAQQRNYADAAAKLDHARRQQQLADRYGEACAAADKLAWEEAVAGFTAVLNADPHYRDARERLEQAQHRHAIAELEGEARRLHRAKQWAAVVKVGERLHDLDPAAGDPDGLVTAARGEIAAAERTRTIAAHYREGLRHLDAGAWQQAMKAFKQVERLDANYRSVQTLLKRVHAELAKLDQPAPEGKPAGADTDGLAATRRAGIAAAEQAATLAAHYREGLRHLDAKAWQQALEAFRQVERLDASYRDVQALLTRANWEVADQDGVARAAKAAAQRAIGPGKETSASVPVRGQTRPVQILRHHRAVLALAFSPDGRLLATGRESNLAGIWDLASGRQLLSVTHKDWRAHAIFDVAFSPDSRWLATASEDKTARVWDVASGQEHRRVVHDAAVLGVAFSPDGRWLATASDDRTARVWNLATGQEHLKVVHDDAVRGVAFSPINRTLATASADKTMGLWEVDKGRELLRLVHGGGVLAVAFSRDGTSIATGSKDKFARIWENASGQQRIAISHRKAVASVAFSPDGRWLATGSSGKIGRIWEVTNGVAGPALQGSLMDAVPRGTTLYGFMVHAVAFSSDGRWFACASDDHTAKIWDLKGGDSD